MNLKKLKRLLSLTLTAAMVASMISVPVNAETVTDNTAAAMEEMIADPADEDVADDADGTDTADDVEDVADEKEDSDVVDETENSDEADETEDEGTAEAAEEELFNAREAGDGSTGEGTGDSGTITPPEAPSPIIVGDGEGQKTLEEAIALAIAEGSNQKTIQLAKNARFAVSPTQAIYNLSGVTIETGDYSLIVPSGADVVLNNATVTHTGTASSMAIYVQGNLTISGGRYTTNGGTMLGVDNGTATITRAEFESQNITLARYTLPVISVEGVDGQLTMGSGKITAVGGASTATNGMYGVYVLDGAQVTLGNATAANDAEDNLKINSVCAAVSMNGMTSPGRITINGGTYQSGLNGATAAAQKKFESVLYLPANANVTINNGVFQAAGESVFSIPYNNVANNANKPLLRLNLNIKNGEFTSTGDVFQLGTGVADNTKIKVAITGGKFSSKPADAYVAAGYGAYQRKEVVEGAEVTRYVVTHTAVAEVNGQGYDSFEGALGAAQAGQTITLNNDIVLETGEYDFSGKTIQTGGHMFKIPEGITATLKGGSGDTAGMIKNSETATASAATKWSEPAANRTILSVQGTLNIDGGKYETAGVKALMIEGSVKIIGGASFAVVGNNGNTYDGASLIDVNGAAAKLEMVAGTVNANIGQGDDGMYGIYVRNGAELVLGTKGQTEQVSPVVTSRFAAIGMNATTAPGRITVNGGTYESTVACTEEGHEIYNAVLYLPATATVTINGGKFRATGSGGNRHVISVPHVGFGDPVKKIELNLVINNGTFEVVDPVADNGDAIFYTRGLIGSGSTNFVSVRGGKYKPSPNHGVTGCYKVSEADSDGFVTVSESTDTSGETGHKLVWKKKVEPSCWKEGIIGHYECSICGKMYQTKSVGEELLLKDALIAKTDHTSDVTPVPGKVGDCTTDGVKAYVMCNNCKKCYDDSDGKGAIRLQNDTDGTQGKSQEEFITKAEGHNYEIVVDWSTVDYAKARKGVSTGIEVTRKCSECTKDGEEGESARTVSVEVLDGSAITDCKVGGTATVKVTGEFATDEFGKAVPVDSDTPWTLDVTKNDFTVAPSNKHTVTDAEFNWDAFNGSEFKTGEANGVTAEATCDVCDAKVASRSVAVICPGGYPAKPLDCTSDALEFQATATFDAKSDTPDSTSATVVEKQSRGGKHILKRIRSYKAPTCTTPGSWAYYQCEGCHRYCFGEDDTTANDGQGKWLWDGQTTEPTPAQIAKDITISMSPHSLKLRGFAWDNEASNLARATFICTNAGCGKTLVINGITATEDKNNNSSSENVPCGTDTKINYIATIHLDKTKVETDSATGNLNYTGDLTATTGLQYTSETGELVKTQPKPHSYVIKEVKWADGDGTDATNGTMQGDTKVHEIDQGIVVTIGCANCANTMKVASNGDVEYTGGLDFLAKVSFDEKNKPITDTDTEGTMAATCTSEGRAFYQVKALIYGDGDMPNQTIEAEDLLATLTPVDEDAHAWTELDWGKEPWQPVMEDGNRKFVTVIAEIEGKNGVTKQCKVPSYTIAATRYCTNGCAISKEQPQEFTGTVGTESTEDAHIVFDIKQREMTCTKGGRTTYEATAYVGDTLVEKYVAPAVYNEDSKGHSLELTWDWNNVYKVPGDEESAVIGVDGLTVERKCANCSVRPDGEDVVDRPKDWFEPQICKIKLTEKETEDEEGNLVPPTFEEATDDKGNPILGEDGKTPVLIATATATTDKGVVLKLEVTKDGKSADCDNSGSVTYDAKFSIPAAGESWTTERRIINAALGHAYRWSIHWDPKDNPSEEDVKNKNIWNVYAERRCQNSGCPDQTTPQRTDLNDKVTYDTENSEVPTCVKKGKDTWNVVAPTLPDGEQWASAADGEPTQPMVTKVVDNIPEDSNAHDYNVATVTPAATTTVITVNGEEKEVLPVTFARTCKRDGADNSHTDSVTLNATTTDKTEDCSKGYDWNFSVNEKEVEALREAGWELPDDYTDTFTHRVAPAEGRKNHDLIRVAGGTSSNDCSEPTHPTYYECKRCTKRYTTQSALTEYSGPGKGEGTPQGHLYGQPVFSWIEEGETVQATFRCTRSQCPGNVTIETDGNKIVSPEELTLVADLEDTPYVEIPAECKDSQNTHTTESGLALPAGIGYAWGLATLRITEGTAQGNLNVNDYFEGELGMYLDHVDHEFVNGTCKWCNLEGGVIINFYGRTNTLVSRLDCSSKEGQRPTADTLTLPTAPNQIGYEFLGWSLKRGDQAASKNIKQEICDLCTEDKTINVYAVYKVIEDKGKVRVDKVLRTDGTDSVIETGSEQEVVIGAKYTATADQLESYHFSHWEKDGAVLGTDTSYSMYVQTTNLVVLKAVYVPDESGVAKPEARVVITDVYGSVVDSVEKLSFVSAISDIPEGWDVSGSGFVYSVKDGIAEGDLTLERTEVSGSGVYKSALNGTQTNIMTVKIGTANKAKTVSARAYVIYTNGTEAKTIYSTMRATSYNDAPQKAPESRR